MRRTVHRDPGPRHARRPESPPSDGSHRFRRTRRTRRRVIAWLAVAVVLLLAPAAAGVFFVQHLGSSFESKAARIDRAFPAEAARPKPVVAPNGSTPVNFLLVGSDSRGSTSGQAVRGAASDQRSDSLLFLHVTADRKSAYLVSIMRDTWVPIAGHGEAKINAALAFGGVPLLVSTVESLLHQHIDHVAFIDFSGFKGLTDAVGGVDVDVPLSFDSGGNSTPGFHFRAGRMHLSGEMALAFVQERYRFPDGDYQRVRNQRAYLKGLLGAVMTPATMFNPVTVSKAVDAFSPYLTVDARLSGQEITGLAWELRGLRPRDLVAFTLPTLGTGWSADGQSIVRLDGARTTAFAQALRSGTVARWVDQEGLRNGN